MPEPETRLCSACEGFDVRSLLLTAERQETRSARHTDDLVRPGLKQFFVQHQNLKDLAICAITDPCELCRAIWKSYSATYSIADSDVKKEDLNSGLGGQPIYFGTEDRNISQQSLPHMVALQLDEQCAGIFRRLACFEVCVPHGTNVYADRHWLASVQAPSSYDDQVFELAQNWISDCENSHTSCKPEAGETPERPTRLLKLKTSYADQPSQALSVRLVDGPEYHDPYAALSYCWGDPTDNPFVLSKTTELELRTGVLASALPATLRDAMIVTSRLNLDLLWIDALCIRQDDHEDWAQESGRMRDIYRRAAVTVEAAAADKSSDGFLKDRASSMPYCRLTWAGDCPDYVRLRPVEDLSEAQLYSSRLYSRGWTLQERLLASRTLSFGKQQITFECMNGYREEARLLERPTTLTQGRILSKAVLKTIRNPDEWYRRLLRFVLKTVGLYPNFFLFGRTWIVEPALLMHMGDAYQPVQTYRELWSSLIHLYSQRCLSKHSDRLPAISGLASEFQRYLDDEYIAGLWRNDLVIGLAWTSSYLHRAESTTTKVVPSLLVEERELVEEWPYGIRNDANAGTPSWSWASVRGPVRLQGDHRINIVALANVVGVNTKPWYDDPNGLLASAYIDLRAPCLVIPDPQPRKAVAEVNLFPCLLSEVREVLEHKPDRAPEFYQQHHHHPDQQFALLKLYQWDRRIDGSTLLPNLQMLLIETCGDGTFRRLMSLRLNYPRTEQEFVQWHMFDDIKSSRLRQREIPYEEYARLHRCEIEEARQLTAELDSALWQEWTIRLA